MPNYTTVRKFNGKLFRFTQKSWEAPASQIVSWLWRRRLLQRPALRRPTPWAPVWVRQVTPSKGSSRKLLQPFSLKCFWWISNFKYTEVLDVPNWGGKHFPRQDLQSHLRSATIVACNIMEQGIQIKTHLLLCMPWGLKHWQQRKSLLIPLSACRQQGLMKMIETHIYVSSNPICRMAVLATSKL